MFTVNWSDRGNDWSLVLFKFQRKEKSVNLCTDVISSLLGQLLEKKKKNNKKPQTNKMYWLISQSRIFTFAHQDSYSNTDQILLTFPIENLIVCCSRALVWWLAGRHLVFCFYFSTSFAHFFLQEYEWKKYHRGLFSSRRTYNIWQSHIFIAAGSGGSSSGFTCFHDCFIHTLAQVLKNLAKHLC